MVSRNPGNVPRRNSRFLTVRDNKDFWLRRWIKELEVDNYLNGYWLPMKILSAEAMVLPKILCTSECNELRYFWKFKPSLYFSVFNNLSAAMNA